MRKYLIILLCALGLGGCIPFILCGGEEDPVVLIITDKKNLDNKLLKDVFLLNDAALEKYNFKTQQHFIDTMQKNGFICKKEICHLFYMKYGYYNNLNFYDEKQHQGLFNNITISYNNFFKNIDISDNFNFRVELQYKKELFKIYKTNPNYISDEFRKKIIDKILPISIKKENLYQFSYDDPRDSCERSQNSIETKQLEQNFNILLKGISNGINK